MVDQTKEAALDSTGGSTCDSEELDQKLPFTWGEFIAICIDMLQAIGKTDTIFEELFTRCEELRLESDFFSQIKSAIERDVITGLVDGQFMFVIENCLRLWPGDVENLDHIICRLSLTGNSHDSLMTLFYEKSLYVCLMKLLLNGQEPNYLLCLNRLFKKIQQEELGLQSREWMLLLSILKSKFGPASENLFCFDGLLKFDKMIHNLVSDTQTIDEKNFQSSMMQILTWVFEKSIFDFVITFDPINILSILSLLFSKSSFSYLELWSNSIGQETDVSRETILNQWKIKIDEISEKDNPEGCQLSTEAKRKLKVGWSLFLLALHYNQLHIISRTQLASELSVAIESLENAVIPQKEAKEESKDIFNITEDFICQVAFLTSELLKANMNDLSVFEVESLLASLLKVTEKNENMKQSFAEPQAVLMFKLGKYLEAVEVISHLDNVIETLQNWQRSIKDPESLKQFEVALKNKIELVIGDNFCHLPGVVDKVFKGKEKELIQALEEKEELKLKVMERVYPKLKENQNFLKEYFSSLCKLNPEAAYSLANKNLIPTDELLSIAEENQAFFCLSYEYARVGLLQKSLVSLCNSLTHQSPSTLSLDREALKSRFFKTLPNLIKKLDSPADHHTFLNYLLKKEEICEVCEVCSPLEMTHGQGKWREILREILGGLLDGMETQGLCQVLEDEQLVEVLTRVFGDETNLLARLFVKHYVEDWGRTSTLNELRRELHIKLKKNHSFLVGIFVYS